MSEPASSLSLDEARVIAEQCVGSKDYDLLDLKEIPLSNDSGGYLSEYMRFEISVRIHNGTEKTYKFFAKTIPRNSGEHRDFVVDLNCYVKEVGYYHKILPRLLKHQEKEETINDEGPLGKWGPKCFLTRDDIIVMEDLAVLNFKMMSSRNPFDWNQCVAVLKKMASFHAATIIYEEKEKQLTGKSYRFIDHHPDCFTPVVDRSLPGDESKGWFKAGVRAVVDLIPCLSKYQHSTKLQRMIQDKIPGVFEKIGEFSTSEKYRNAVCHGDLWASNILFCYGDDNRPTSVRFVDYQILRYAPPATDIMGFINTTTTRKFRDRHYKEMLKVYYDEFTSELLKNGLSANELLNYEELVQSCEYFSTAGRVMAGLFYQQILMDSEKKSSIFSSGPDDFSAFFLVNRSAHVRECFQKDEVYRCRYEESLTELIDKDILKENS